ncbi:hypothetical protein B0T13DRAFT_131213 [Neurospora crassa]|nr:hypothetical protein B0T13DRAFT_131213 [Neurospora crassa]
MRRPRRRTMHFYGRHGGGAPYFILFLLRVIRFVSLPVPPTQKGGRWDGSRLSNVGGASTPSTLHRLAGATVHENASLGAICWFFFGGGGNGVFFFHFGRRSYTANYRGTDNSMIDWWSTYILIDGVRSFFSFLSCFWCFWHLWRLHG